MSCMIKKYYTINRAYSIIFLNRDIVVIKGLSNQFSIKGTGIGNAVKEILDYFKESALFEDVTAALSSKYSLKSLQKLLDYLAKKSVLIYTVDSDELYEFDKEFLEKSYAYTLSGMSLKEIGSIIASAKVGIIGISAITNDIIYNLRKIGISGKINIVATDDELAFRSNFEEDIVYHDLYSNESFNQKFIDESDLIIAAANYNNHFLFNQINELCLKKRKSWIRILVEGISAEIGPLFITGETACYSCMHSRRQRHMNKEEFVVNDLYATSIEFGDSLEKVLKFSNFYPLYALSATIASSEAIKYLVNMKCNLKNQVLIANCVDFDMETNYIHKDYYCSVCAGGKSV